MHVYLLKNMDRMIIYIECLFIINIIPFFFMYRHPCFKIEYMVVPKMFFF